MEVAAGRQVLAAHTLPQNCFQALLLAPVLWLELEVERRIVVPVVEHNMGTEPAGNIDNSCHIQHTDRILDIDDSLLPYLELHILDTELAAAAAADGVADECAYEALVLALPVPVSAALAVGQHVLAAEVANTLQLADIQRIHKLPAPVVECLPVALMLALKVVGRS